MVQTGARQSGLNIQLLNLSKWNTWKPENQKKRKEKTE